jgi:hypothetical protein
MMLTMAGAAVWIPAHRDAASCLERHAGYPCGVGLQV